MPIHHESMRILVVKLVAIGDLVVALPTIKALQKSFKRAHLVMLVTPRVKEVVEGLPYLNEIIYYDIFGKHRSIVGFFKFLKEVRKRRFDLVIELDHYYRISTIISYISGARERIGFDLSGQGRRGLFTKRVPYRIDCHEVEAFLETAKAVGAEISNKDKQLIEIWCSEADKKYVADLFKEWEITPSDRLVGIHPGSGITALSRRWMPERFAEVADWLISTYGVRVIFTGSKDELELITAIRSQMHAESIVSAGKTTLKQFAELTRHCELFISIDTGPMHIAAAMKTRVIGLFGPNTPVKWGPYGDGNIAIYKKIPCSPCTRQYLGQISRCKESKCMEAILCEDVMVAVKSMLKAVKIK